MNDLHDILAHHHGRPKTPASEGIHPERNSKGPTYSEIPDLLFDEILIKHRPSRQEILLLLFIYRQVWCRPNLFKCYGYSPVMSYDDMCSKLGMEMNDLFTALKKLESQKLIETIRAGQYFIRKYLTAEHDYEYGINYDDF